MNTQSPVGYGAEQVEQRDGAPGLEPGRHSWKWFASKGTSDLPGRGLISHMPSANLMCTLCHGSGEQEEASWASKQRSEGSLHGDKVADLDESNRGEGGLAYTRPSVRARVEVQEGFSDSEESGPTQQAAQSRRKRCEGGA